MQSAPFYADLAEGPEGGKAYWIVAEDGVRIRLGVWPGQGSGLSGTVLLFPGRTEYIEKYGINAVDLCGSGLHVAAVDWRGQGLADRPTDDLMLGHVGDFSEYQLDVAAVVKAAEELGLPKPWFLLAHSMGGSIGLRALMEGLPVAAAAFSAPMWGIDMSALTRPFAWGLSWTSRILGFDKGYAPSTLPEAYVISEPFKTNRLTRDPEMYDYMIRQVEAQPGLKLGGPSLRWLYEALSETRRLSRLPSPDVPCLTVLGTDEDVVDPRRVHDRMARWPGGVLEISEGARHEVLMEGVQTRGHVTACLTHFFQTYQSPKASGSLASFVCPDHQSQAPSHRLQQGNA